MKNLNEIRKIKKAVEAEILKRPGVTGVDIGYKIVKGRKTKELAIRVLVEEKKDVPAKERIPNKIKNIKTDVIQRKFVLHPLKIRVDDLGIKADTGTYDPIQGGISIGPCRTIGGFVYVGTLGAVVRDNASGDPMFLSNFHVMCVNDAWSVGDTMAQPSRVDGGSCPADVVGTLQRAQLGGEVDCAVADHTDRDFDCSIVDIGDVAGTANAAEGMAVRKRGRTSGLTYGTIDTVDLTVTIDYEDGLGDVTLTDQIGIEVDATQSVQFGTNGDSGSVVVNDDNNVVGLYYAGNDAGTYGAANPINSVLTALDVNMCVPKNKEIEKKIEVKELEKKLEIAEKMWRKEKYEIKEYHKEHHKEHLKDYVKDLMPDKHFKEKEKDIYEGWGNKINEVIIPKQPVVTQPVWPTKPAQPITRVPKTPPRTRVPRAPRSTDERLANLEAAVSQLSHFIQSDLRPDLNKGALNREPDLGNLSQDLQKQATNAKQAKDNKDVEKLCER